MNEKKYEITNIAHPQMCGRTSMPVTWAALSNRRKI